MSVHDLPALNATLNGISAVLLLIGWVLIRSRRIEAHRICMIAAFSTSSVFLASYLVYHAQVGSVPFTRPGFGRPLYLTILLTHVVLAAVTNKQHCNSNSNQFSVVLSISTATVCVRACVCDGYVCICR